MSEINPYEFTTVPEGWECKRLIKCTDEDNISYGIVQPGQHVDNGVPVIRINNVKNGQLDLGDVLKVSPEIERKYERTRLKGGEVLLTLVGSTGQSFVAPVELKGWNVPRAIAVIRAKSEIGADWINICLQSQETKHFLDVRANTTVQKTLNLKDVRDIPILIPPKEVKESITNMALSLSNKIELNRQMNQTLEDIAQALFKSWFVDFEPVKAKVIVRGKGGNALAQSLAAQAIIAGTLTLQQLEAMEVTSLGLEETIHPFVVKNFEPSGLDYWMPEQLESLAKLFPNNLVESEQGEIPEGWSIKSMEELSTNVAMGPFGSNIKVETFVDDGIPIINGQQLRGTLLADGRNKFITNEHAEKLSKCNVFRGDIVITHRGTLGQVSIIPEGSKYERYIVSQSQCYIRPNCEVISPLFMIHYFKSYIGQHELLAHKSQVGVPSIAKPVTNLRKIELIVPSKGVSDEFHQLVNNMYNKISQKKDEILLLEEMRNALLPKLLSGELRVSEEVSVCH